MEATKNSDIILFLIAGTAVLMLLAGAVVVFFRLYRKKIIRQQQRIFEAEKQYQQDLLYSNIQSVEDERKRIAKDIHDELGSIFSTLSLQLRKPGPDMSGSQQLIETGLQTVRRIAHEMMPPELELFGLEKALENLALRINQSGNLKAFIHWDAQLPALSEAQSLALYRISQELISNTLKHAGATEIDISLTRSENGQALYAYTDNGKGLPASIQKPGMGLKNIESRAGMIGAKLVSGTPPEKGYRCILQVPLGGPAAS